MPEMKNSGIEWIGEIPSHWAVLRNKYNFDLNKNIVGTAYSDTQLLSLTKNGVKAITEDDQRGKVPTSFATYQTVDKDDIVMCLFDLDVSAVFSGISPYEGMISPAYKCFKCKEHLFPQYIDYYFRTVFVDRKYKRYSKNVRYSISADEFMALPILVPPLEVQKSIANFLDQKCSEIDSLSTDIQSQIDILEEYKKSVITEAVTKGLNPDVEMKDSGIEWIGMIPKDWSIKPLKYSFSITSGSTPNSSVQDFWDGDVLWVTPADFKTNDYYTFGGRRNISEIGYKSCSTNIVPANSIVFSKRAPIGSVVINKVPLCTNQGCLACVPIRSLNVKFYYYVMSIYDEIFNLFGNGTTFKEISATVFGNMHFAEPTIEEQHSIASHLDAKCIEIDTVIADKKSQLETLAEYKKSLIYEYVTGKKEVPEFV